ncbi:CopG family transcriptional regulator [Brucella pseudintermedia]|uniref:Ribbon-helix-helix domain-containing protein n=1 Tax=Brucella pseudintermedia TaxID=370111 RepID=A0ABY5UEB2_9HYPH|nr:CopG family transcriptional regulator [Brucella pseudintermedia]UWL61689.1 ribbon-helix-helix domain-containing protein [Brucella pseudintermedia]
MAKRTRMNVYFDPELLGRVKALSLRRRVSQSAVIEAAVASFLSGDTAEHLEAAMSRRLDRISRQIDALDIDVAILGETLALFIHYWMTVTPPLPESARQSARAKGTERFEGFMQTLGRRLAAGDRFLRELSRDVPGEEPKAPASEPQLNPANVQPSGQ